MATVPLKEAEMGFKPLVAQIEELQTHLRKDSGENVCQHLCVPGFFPHGSKPAQRIIAAAVVDVMHL